MFIRFRCKRCGKSLKVLTKDAGRQGKCPKCGAPIRVPIPKAGPVVAPVAPVAPPPPARPAGVLAELREHPSWIAAGTVACTLLGVVAVGLVLVSKGQREVEPDPRASYTPPVVDANASMPGGGDRATAQPTGSLASGMPGEPKELPPPPKIANELPRPKVDLQPLWAKIVLNETLFPPDLTWKHVQGVFHAVSNSDPNVLRAPAALWSTNLFRGNEGVLRPEDLSKIYGPAFTTVERGFTWHIYDVLAFGVKSQETLISKVRAPVHVFQKGFVESALRAGIAEPNDFFGPDKGDTSEPMEQEKVVIDNQSSLRRWVSVGGAGPFLVQPEKDLTLPLRSAWYVVEVRSPDNIKVTSAPMPAFPHACWEITDDPNGGAAGVVRLTAGPSPSSASTGMNAVSVELVSKHSAPLTVRVGSHGRYHRLPSGGKVHMLVKDRRNLLHIEDGTFHAYQIVETPEAAVWTVSATKGRLPFSVEVTPDPNAASAGDLNPLPGPPICPIDPNNPKGLRRQFSHGESVSRVAFSPEGAKVLSTGDREWRLWDLAQEAQKPSWHAFPGRPSSAAALTFERDGRKVWFSDASGANLVCLDTSTGEELGGIRQRSYRARAAAFSQDAGLVLLREKSWLFWDPELDAPQGPWTTSEKGPPADTITACVLSRAGDYALYGTASGRLVVLDMSDPSRKEPVCDFRAHQGRINAVAFDPNGEWIVSGGEDRIVRVWSLASEKEITHFEAHTDSIRTVAASPVERKVLSASLDGTVRIWDLRSSKEIECLKEPVAPGPILSACFSPDGSLVASGSEDGIVRVWKLTLPSKPAPKKICVRQVLLRPVAPDTDEDGSKSWISSEGCMSFVSRKSGNFIWILLATPDDASRSAAKDMHIVDGKGNNIASLFAAIDPPASRVRVPRNLFVNPESDSGARTRARALTEARERQKWLSGIATGGIFRGDYRQVLLIFEDERSASGPAYLTGPNNFRELLRLPVIKPPSTTDGSAEGPRGDKGKRPVVSGKEGRGGKAISDPGRGLKGDAFHNVRHVVEFPAHSQIKERTPAGVQVGSMPRRAVRPCGQE